MTTEEEISSLRMGDILEERFKEILVEKFQLDEGEDLDEKVREWYNETCGFNLSVEGAIRMVQNEINQFADASNTFKGVMFGADTQIRLKEVEDPDTGKKNWVTLKPYKCWVPFYLMEDYPDSFDGDIIQCEIRGSPESKVGGDGIKPETWGKLVEVGIKKKVNKMYTNRIIRTVSNAKSINLEEIFQRNFKIPEYMPKSVYDQKGSKPWFIFYGRIKGIDLIPIDFETDEDGYTKPTGFYNMLSKTSDGTGILHPCFKLKIHNPEVENADSKWISFILDHQMYGRTVFIHKDWNRKLAETLAEKSREKQREIMDKIFGNTPVFIVAKPRRWKIPEQDGFAHQIEHSTSFVIQTNFVPKPFPKPKGIKRGRTRTTTATIANRNRAVTKKIASGLQIMGLNASMEDLKEAGLITSSDLVGISPRLLEAMYHKASELLKKKETKKENKETKKGGKSSKKNEVILKKLFKSLKERVDEEDLNSEQAISILNKRVEELDDKSLEKQLKKLISKFPVEGSDAEELDGLFEDEVIVDPEKDKEDEKGDEEDKKEHDEEEDKESLILKVLTEEDNPTGMTLKKIQKGSKNLQKSKLLEIKGICEQLVKDGKLVSTGKNKFGIVK